ncbi:hypothetical protein AAZX31_08G272500 [Glycine max]|uniref:Octicosapeptide/Phox/Bem1p domain-containing protein n=3 Tax=Glycine subgen. Soja TaxID=1462606 RepID=K7L9F8_SOYBN|nr:uncharacterized protein LOC100786933 [Glycine max]XP_028244004.1 uncharacterized protein LOC114422030 [Glycine soja]ARW71733.1 octicosapeptide/Phox/Bem1p domain-containing protein [Glycine max]ARW71734.1 octicosapeptide/Phox/Bem1p domain-containing protein [Glycine max]KAG5017167.1 hypothetical protein JHK85_023303 [Glycine max]KAG5026923.1 hypothetical protein JHK86_022837 [Glycine max]KAG5138068.1 hypothetical protein JHK82_022799 [Glycine max]|eukprot:XP_003530626.1 uncharacterized protein LOC100786933 [Glycine max]
MVGPSPSHGNNLKFLCSYGGKILPRFPDSKLRYFGGHTRVLALPRSAPFSEVMVKLEELCGAHVTHLRCQLPTEDLDALVSITCDEDLNNLVEEYDGAVSSLKIRAFLCSSPAPSKSSSTTSSSCSSSSSSPSSCCRTAMAAPPQLAKKSYVSLSSPRYYSHPRVQGNRGVVYLVPSGNHWH